MINIEDVYKYIDGDCNEQEAQQISYAIDNDKALKDLYTEIIGIENSLRDIKPITIPVSVQSKVVNALRPKNAESKRRDTVTVCYMVSVSLMFMSVFSLAISEPISVSFTRYLPSFDFNLPDLSFGLLTLASISVLVSALLWIDKIVFTKG